MSDLELELLQRMTTDEGITAVIESGVGVEVFVGEDPINRAVFAWMVGDYWPKYHSAPSLDAVEEQYLGTDAQSVRARIADADCDEPTGFLIESLHRRFAWDQLQDIVRDAAETGFADPGGTARTLREASARLDDQLARGASPSDITYENAVAKRATQFRVDADAKRRLEDEADQGPTSWEPVELGPYLRGEIQIPEPCLGVARSDGVRLIYPGREHSIVSDTEAGKTWIACACAAAEIEAGNRVVYIHYEEADPASTVERLLLLGADPDDTDKLLTFVGPTRPVREEYLTELLDPAPALVVHDGMNEGMSLHKAMTKEVEGVGLFRQQLVVPFLAVNAAALTCDHFPMSHDPGRRDAYGSVHKGNALNGARFALQNVEPFGRGMRGRSHLFVTKDRPGFLREHGRPTKVAGKTFFGTLVIDNVALFGTPRFELALHAPSEEDTVGQESEANPVAGLLADALYTIVANQPDHTIESQRMLFARLRLAVAGGFANDDARRALEDLLVSAPPRLIEFRGPRGAKSYRAVVSAP